MDQPKFTRRTGLGAIGALLAGGVAFGSSTVTLAASAQAARPWLATPRQVEAEAMIRRLIEDPAIKSAEASTRAELAAGAYARGIPDAMATIDRAVAQWIKSLAFGELIKDTANPAMLWGTDDTPRDWLGYTLGGVGTSGDNPDNIYRTGAIEGGGRYELLGQYHPDSRPTQVLVEIHATDIARPSTMMTPTANGRAPDPQSVLQTNQDQFVVDDQGRFRITLGEANPGEWASPNHLVIPDSGVLTVAVRDLLTDWKMRPAGLTLRRVGDGPKGTAIDYARLRAMVLEDLPGYIKFWSAFPTIWFGGLKPNTHSPPQQRPGGWGFVAGVNFHLADDEGMLLTLDPGGARYTGFQINDPWMIQPDVRVAPVSLNKSQVTPNADGTVTYVIARSDPGLANWLATDGMRDGIGIVRWQAVPPGLKGDGLIREFRVLKLSELAALDLPRVTPEERKQQVAARWADYSTRTR